MMNFGINTSFLLQFSVIKLINFGVKKIRENIKDNIISLNFDT